MQLGPTRRSPAPRASASSAAWPSRPSASTSPNPEERMTAARTPRAASAVMASAHGRRRQAHQGQVHGLGKRGDRTDRGHAEDRLAGGIHRMDRAVEAALQHVAQQAVAELGGIARDAEHGDAARREERGEVAHRRGRRSSTRTALPWGRSSVPTGQRRTSGLSASRSRSSRRSRAGHGRIAARLGLHHHAHPVAGAVGVELRSGTRGRRRGAAASSDLDLARIEVHALEDHHVVGAAAQTVQTQATSGRTRSGPVTQSA